MATRRNWQPLWIGLRFVISGGLLAYLVWQANPASIWAQWQRANLGLLLLAVLLQIVCIMISAFKWGVLLRANRHPQPYPWLLAVYFIGQFANNFLPTSVGGDAMRVVALGRRTGSYAQASASVFMERLTGFLALSLIALLALLVTSTDLFGARLVTAPALTLLAGGFALVAIMAAVVSFASPWLLPRISRFLPAVARRPLYKIAEALGEYGSDRGTLAKVMGLSLLFHGTWITVHLVCGLALYIEAPPLIYALMVPLTDILGLAPIFFNNVGARDLVFTIYLRQVGVPNATALALAFTVFTVRLVVSSIGGLILLFGGADLRGTPRADLDTEPPAAEAAGTRRP
ncbi:MAG: flippase-like domain-containing protein [Chloroflexales bacterium]|nr:flippase-like domain-containing protein [Chloroflexales bacterium]